MSETTTFTPGREVGMSVTCQGDGACKAEPTLLIWSFNQYAVGVDGILVCADHRRYGHSTLGQRTSAIMFTTPLRNG
jgi:hypothetical protein